MPEIQTLFGVTAGGKTFKEEKRAVNLINAWKYVLFEVAKDDFIFSIEFSSRLHAILEQGLSLRCGKFRNGNVSISGSDYKPPSPDKLSNLHDEMLNNINNNDSLNAACDIFLTHARYKFFANSMTHGLLVMNAFLLSRGFPAFGTIPKGKGHNFNQSMLAFYSDSDSRAIKRLLFSCIPEWVRTEFLMGSYK